MKRKAYMSKNAGCTGPYSHAVDTGEYIFLSGQTPIDPATGEVVKGGITEQTKQSFKNLMSILDEMGMSEEDVQKVNVYLTERKNRSKDLFFFKQTGLLKNIETGCLINTSLQYYMYHSYVTQRK